MSELWTDERIIAEVDWGLSEADADTRERARRLLRRAVLNEGRACEERVADLQKRIAELEAELAAERNANRIDDANLTGELTLQAGKIKALEAQLDPDALTAAYLRGVSDGKAKARRWEPITVETFSTEQSTLAIADNEFSIVTDSGYDIEVVGWTLPDNVRFSRRVAGEGEGGNE